MGRIELEISEWQAMKKKATDLESALNTVSQESAKNKEIVEQVKALIVDLEHENLINRMFAWKAVVKPFKDLFKEKKKKGN